VRDDLNSRGSRERACHYGARSFTPETPARLSGASLNELKARLIIEDRDHELAIVQQVQDRLCLQEDFSEGDMGHEGSLVIYRDSVADVQSHPRIRIPGALCIVPKTKLMTLEQLIAHQGGTYHAWPGTSNH